MADLELHYQTGFGNEFATEAMAGALPEGQNSPQQPAFGLYAELVSGTPFTAPRSQNRRTWMYRIRPAAAHEPFAEVDPGLMRSGPFDEVPAPPTQLRWDPLPIPGRHTDFVDGIVTLGGNGDPSVQSGVAIHWYAANAPMQDRFFYNADGELVLIPQQGRVRVFTELGIVEARPSEICVVPRGIRFRVELPDGPVRGLLVENYGMPLRLPDLGPIGSNGLANPRDFQTPVAAFEDRDGGFQLTAKFQGRLWSAAIGYSPLNVVAWHGNYAPYKYDLLRFVALSTVSVDHADPSIYTVLTAPTAVPGTANMDLVAFPPRWQVTEHTFRPPAFHRNVASELLFLVQGKYFGKGRGFSPGGVSLHNCMSGHGPDADTYERASTEKLEPEYLADTLTAMVETQLVMRPTKFALETELRQREYYQSWLKIKNQFRREPATVPGE